MNTLESIATALAKYEFNEVQNIVSNLTFIDAYNVLSGYKLEIDEINCENELIDMQISFRFSFKHIEGTIFKKTNNGCELHECVNVWDYETKGSRDKDVWHCITKGLDIE
jgi:hypothetical protein